MNPAQKKLLGELNTLLTSAEKIQANLSQFFHNFSSKEKGFGETQILEMGYSPVHPGNYIRTDGTGYNTSKEDLYARHIRAEWEPGSKLEYAFLLAASKFSITANILYLSCLSTGTKADINELRKLQNTFDNLYPIGVCTLKDLYQLDIGHRVSEFRYGNKSIRRQHFSDFLQDDNFQLQCSAPALANPARGYLSTSKAPEIDFYSLFPESEKEDEKRIKAVVNEISKMALLRYPFFITFPELDAYIADICMQGNIQDLFPKDIPNVITPPNVLNGKAIGFSNTRLNKLNSAEEILMAITFDNTNLLKELLADHEKENGKDALNVFIRDNALLGFAAANGHTRSIETFLQLGANVEQRFAISFAQAEHSNKASNPWLNGTPVFKHYKDKYANSTLELTPLGLMLLAAPMLSQEQAKQAIQVLLNNRADYHTKVQRSWSETYGYYTSQQTRTKAEHIKLFDFDSTGLLSATVTEQRSQRNARNKGGPKAPVTHTYLRSGGSASKPAGNQGDLQKRVNALEAEVTELRAIILDMQQRLATVEGASKTPRQSKG